MAYVTNNGAVVTTSDAVDPNDVVYLAGIALRKSDGAMYVTSGFTTGQIASLLNVQQTLAVFGDSIALNHSTSTSVEQKGGACWGLAFAGQPLYFDNSLNFGVSGNTTTQILARVATVIAAAPSRVYLSAGINDTPNGVPYATTIANLLSIIQQLTNAGIAVDYRSLTPRSNSSWGAFPTGRPIALQVNDYMRKLARTQRLLTYVDVYPLYVDPASTTSDPLTGMTETDGLHPSIYGACMEGAYYAQTVLSLLPSKRTQGASYADYIDLTNNPGGNLLYSGTESYGSMNGSNTLVGTGYAGNWADGLTPSRIAGAGTITGAKESTAIATGTNAIATGNTYNRQVLTFAATNGTDKFKLLYNVAVGLNAAIGDQLFAELEVELVAVAGLTNISGRLTEGWGSFNVQVGLGDQSTANSIAPPTITTGANKPFVIRCPIDTVAGAPSGGIQLDIRVEGLNATPLSGTIKLGRPRIVNLTKGGAF